MDKLYINYKGIALSLLRSLWIIALAFLLVFIGAYTTLEIPKVPRYSATATMYVSNMSQGSTTSAYSSSLAYSAQAMIKVCSVVIKSNKAMNDIMNRLDDVDGVADGLYTGSKGDVYTAAAIKGSIKVASVSDTEVMSISLTSATREDAAVIVNAIIAVVPEIIIDVIHVGYAEVLDTAYFSGTTNLPSYRTPASYGLFAMLAIIAVIILLNLLDNRIHTKDELMSVYGMSVLGEIPNFSTKSNERYHYYGRYGKNYGTKETK